MWKNKAKFKKTNKRKNKRKIKRKKRTERNSGRLYFGIPLADYVKPKIIVNRNKEKTVRRFP